VQRPRRRCVDRFVAVVPLDAIARGLLAEDFTYDAGTRLALGGLGLGDDAISDLECHGSSFLTMLRGAYSDTVAHERRPA
jgi:hypothetical protein